MAPLESTLVNSIVGSGTFFKGTITVSGLLRIDGDFRGEVKTDGRVIIGRDGRADCTIDAATVVIGGVFRGTIYAREKVIALESAIVTGNIYSPRLIGEFGVVLDGALHIRGVEAALETNERSQDVMERAGGESVTKRTNRRTPYRKRRSGSEIERSVGRGE